MSHTAEDRDAVERHLARSVLALAVTTGTAFSVNNRGVPGHRGPGVSPGRAECPPGLALDGTGGTDGQPEPAAAQSPDLDAPVRAGSALTGRRCLELFGAQLASRHLDLAARWLRAQGAGFFTIGSSGHEGNAAVAAALRPGDPALLHYRSCAFYLVRAAQAVPPRDGVGDVLLGLAAAAEEPIAGGRHKVLGHADLHTIPTTSTIASHLPRALGLAFSLDRTAHLGAAAP